jgi:hypothetical protein
MSIRFVFSASAAAVLMFAMTASTNAAGQAAGQAKSKTESQITLVGCLQREADYRKEHKSGRGGPVSTGLGLKNEYVLVNGSTAGTTDAAPMCTGSGAGEAYELTGKRERDLEKYVGHAVEITGTLKNAKLDQTGKPTGGFDPLKQDLELREVNITSFRDFAPHRAAAAEPAQAPESVVAHANPDRSAPQQVATSGAQRELPRTAGPLPLTGLIGLLSFAGALGIRSLRQ